MSILCGIDFSETSIAATTVASQFAAKLRLPLHLVHAIQDPSEGAEPALTKPIAAAAETRLRAVGSRLPQAGASVESHVERGSPDEVVVKMARELSAQLIVVGAVGQRSASEWQLGSHAARTAERSHVPVLVVRNAQPFTEWLAGSRTLRVTLGIDASLSSECAAQWVLQLASLGPCEVVLTHLYWPPEELHRLGFGGTRDWGDPDVTRALQTNYERRFAELFAAARVTCRFDPHVGRIGDGLASVAVQDEADLVVVGCHDRSPLQRLWHGSISERTLRCAPMSVACIPAPLQAAQDRPGSTIGSVLVATDFSKIGNAAIPLAYSVASYRGTVHLLHVIEAGRSPLDAYDVFVPQAKLDAAAMERLRARLSELVPRDWHGAAALTQVHLIEAPHAATAICQAAERLGVDLICLGTHARHGLGRALLGSVAASVLEQTHRPVLLARGPLE